MLEPILCELTRDTDASLSCEQRPMGGNDFAVTVVAIKNLAHLIISIFASKLE